MIRLGAIVEGYGDVEALPSLVTRILSEKYERYAFFPKKPVRVDRGRFAEKFSSYSKALRLLAPQSDAIVVVLDSDDDDPETLRDSLVRRATDEIAHVRVCVAPAVREYEAWFLASIPEMAGQLHVPSGATYDGLPEAVRGAKDAFKMLLSNGVYSETIDQKKYTALIDIEAAAERAPSFAQLVARLGEATSDFS